MTDLAILLAMDDAENPFHVSSSGREAEHYESRKRKADMIRSESQRMKGWSWRTPRRDLKRGEGATISPAGPTRSF